MRASGFRSANPHPNPLPEYRERGQEATSASVNPFKALPGEGTRGWVPTSVQVHFVSLEHV